MLEYPAFYVGARDQIQALMRVRQILYQLCHLPRLSRLFENRKMCWFLRVTGISLNTPNQCFPVSKANFVSWFCFVSWGEMVCFLSQGLLILAEDDLQLLILLPPPPKCRDDRHHHAHLSFIIFSENLLAVDLCTNRPCTICL